MPNIILPVRSETWDEHFVNNGWTCPQDQIDAGYPRYLQPGGTYAKIAMIHDVGAIVPASIISATFPVTALAGSVTITTTIAYSPDLLSWTVAAPGQQVFASNFRYVKITIEATPDSPGSLAEIGDIRLNVSTKLRNDSGSATALASDNLADPNKGTQVFFNVPFIDVNSITFTPHYQAAQTKGISVVINFQDVPNPTYFRVLLYSNLDGSRLDGGGNWHARGV